jgi:hypothetical protein
MHSLDPQHWTKDELERHSLDMRQFIGFRESTLANGMRIIEVYSASGLTFTLLPDRGLDIWSASYKGIPLTWIAPGSPHPPDYGQSWLQQFNGGLLTTCGLAHVGPPEVDSVSGERRDLHGNFTRLRAQEVGLTHPYWTDYETEDGKTQWRYEVGISGLLHESRLFGSQLQVRRAVHFGFPQADIGLYDFITNLGDEPVPLMLLYHINLGWPLIGAGATLHTPHTAIYPRDAAARAGFDSWSRYEAASAGYPEQVFFHHLKTTAAQPEPTGMTTVAVANAEADLALCLQWDFTTLPYFTQWKNTRQGIYVCGIEPGNCIPEGQNAARANGRLQMIQPGETVETYLSLDVVEGAEAVKGLVDRINTPLPDARPLPNCKLDDYA